MHKILSPIDRVSCLFFKYPAQSDTHLLFSQCLDLKMHSSYIFFEKGVHGKGATAGLLSMSSVEDPGGGVEGTVEIMGMAARVHEGHELEFWKSRHQGVHDVRLFSFFSFLNYSR